MQHTSLDLESFIETMSISSKIKGISSKSASHAIQSNLQFHDQNALQKLPDLVQSKNSRKKKRSKRVKYQSVYHRNPARETPMEATQPKRKEQNKERRRVKQKGIKKNSASPSCSGIYGSALKIWTRINDMNMKRISISSPGEMKISNVKRDECVKGRGLYMA